MISHEKCKQFGDTYECDAQTLTGKIILDEKHMGVENL